AAICVAAVLALGLGAWAIIPALAVLVLATLLAVRSVFGLADEVEHGGRRSVQISASQRAVTSRVRCKKSAL
ncbi:MAG: hypothetical protein JWQ18_2367, partial [Conexibacter sp.]|nr:hypothetical protein [Conexibacter sp.]